MDPLVTISILSYNDEATIETAVKSAALQLWPRIELIVFDNNSKDNTKRLLAGMKERLPGLRSAHLSAHGVENAEFRFHILESKENIGFAPGHNRIIAMAKGEYVLLLNSDAGLDDNFLKNAMRVFAGDERIAAVQGKLYRLDPDTEEPRVDEATKKPIIDTTGLLMLKNRRIINRGQGTPDTGMYDRQEEIFGADGAAPLYRKTSLEDVKICLGARCEYLDEDFFSYKEDVDLAWRLRLAGWKAVYAPDAVGYHQRGSGESAATSYIAIMGERRRLSKLSKYHAFKNQRLMQAKNDMPSLLAKHFFRWFPKEIGSWFYVLAFERYTWRAFGRMLRLLPKMLRKRRVIMKSRKVSAKDMERWFN
ncbi:MAG: glycosyltransferase family 2 protein [bacterium]|nr:glycosyltransferase family 2 protein [bacterium]